jgi:hypothetical protein
MKILNILETVISEGRRFQFPPEVYTKMMELTEKLWSLRNKPVTKKTFVDNIRFKTSDGVDGNVKVVINPRLKFIGSMETKPAYSRDPMDFVMELQPKEYVSKKNLFLTIYHEMLHATDPSQSTKMSIPYLTTYSEFTDDKYWGHPIEFRAISNEFMEGLVYEYKRRLNSLKKIENKKYLLKSLDNLLGYFAKGEQRSKLTDDILFRINDENLPDSRIAKLVADIQSEYPQISELIPRKKDDPYYITYIELIKEHGPKLWPKFLSLLYNTVEEIREIIINKKGLN